MVSAVMEVATVAAGAVVEAAGAAMEVAMAMAMAVACAVKADAAMMTRG